MTFYFPEFNVGDRIPTEIGEYEVLDVLGSGGMGAVYRVVPAEASRGKRQKALKTIHPQLLDRPEVIERFEAEGRVLSEFDHDNIIKIDGIYTMRSNPPRPFILMELLQGYTLRYVMDQSEGALAVRDACTVAIGVLNALEEIHRQNMIHRDIKPENIFVQKRRKGPTRVVLIDFGIMKIILDEGQVRTRRTVRTFLGSYSNASPEQLSGQKVSPKSDFYSLATILYEMLAGMPMFPDVKEPRAIGQAHVDQMPAPLHEVAPHVPREISDVVMQALSKDPAARPGDAHAFRTPFAIIRNQNLRNEAPLAGNSTIEQLLNHTVASDCVPATAPVAITQFGETMATAATTIPQAAFHGTMPDVSRETDLGRLEGTPIQRPVPVWEGAERGWTDQTSSRSRHGTESVPLDRVSRPLIAVIAAMLPVAIGIGYLMVHPMDGAVRGAREPAAAASQPVSAQPVSVRAPPLPPALPPPEESARPAVSVAPPAVDAVPVPIAAPPPVASVAVTTAAPPPAAPAPAPAAPHAQKPRAPKRAVAAASSPTPASSRDSDIDLFEDVSAAKVSPSNAQPSADGGAKRRTLPPWSP